MTDLSLIYVSNSCIDSVNRKEEIAALVDAAAIRNSTLGVTGALISTGKHFAQCLEGEKVKIDKLMESIRPDPRHTDVRVVQFTPIDARQFAAWNMAYIGESTFVERAVTRLIECPVSDQDRAVQNLITLMAEFVKPKLT